MLLVKGSIEPPKERQTGQGVTWLRSRKTLESGSGSGLFLFLLPFPQARSSLIPFLFTPVVSIQGWMEVGSTDPETAAIRSKNICLSCSENLKQLGRPLQPPCEMLIAARLF